MANDGKFLNITAGRTQQENAINTSAGAGDAGKIIKLDAAGLIPLNMMPTGIGPDIEVVVASEALASGDFVAYWDDAGTIKVRKADATAAGKEGMGYVLAAVLLGGNATVYHEGTNNALAGLTLGARYYLSAASPGTPTNTPPSGSGNVSQYLGVAVSAAKISFEPSEGVILA